MPNVSVYFIFYHASLHVGLYHQTVYNLQRSILTATPNTATSSSLKE